MDYNNQVCAACGKLLNESDDIVVCPVCATPQHRECWVQNGKCANDDLHESGYVWKRAYGASAVNEKEQEKEETVSADADETENIRICHICGSENPSDSLHCGNCGELFNAANDEQGEKKCPHCGKINAEDALHCNQCGVPLGANASSNAFFGGTPYIAGTNISADEKIGENTAGDLAVYTRTSARNYIKKFKRFENGKKLSFNFGAFFFAPGWFFYRKLYKVGIFFLVAFTTVAILTSNQYSVIEKAALKYAEPIETAYAEFYEASTDEKITEEELNAKMKPVYDLMMKYFKETGKAYLIFYGSTFALSFICALIADRMYYKKVLEDIRKINEEEQELPVKRMMLAQMGGTSVLAFVACSLGENLLINMLFSAATVIKDLL